MIICIVLVQLSQLINQIGGKYSRFWEFLSLFLGILTLFVNWEDAEFRSQIGAKKITAAIFNMTKHITNSAGEISTAVDQKIGGLRSLFF
jgi:hypothetical protein